MLYEERSIDVSRHSRPFPRPSEKIVALQNNASTKHFDRGCPVPISLLSGGKCCVCVLIIHDLSLVPRQGRGTQNRLIKQKRRGGLLDQLCCQAGMTSLNPEQFEHFDRGCPAPISLLSGGN